MRKSFMLWMLLGVWLLLAIAANCREQKTGKRHRQLAAFDPVMPTIGKMPHGRRGQQHVRLMVHDAAFMVRVLRGILKDERHPSANNPEVPLYKRFPYQPVVPDMMVTRHCSRDFISCVSYLSHLSRVYQLSTEQDTLTRRTGYEQGLCSPRGPFRIFCLDAEVKGSENKKGLQSVSHVKKTVRKEGRDERQRRFAELVTASQYMCWYTMHEIPYLANMLQCDSTKPNQKAPDNDFRANTGDIFACAMYSFCPNPCCPRPHETNNGFGHCENRSPSGPCSRWGKKDGEGCTVDRNLNRNFYHLAIRDIQINCDCSKTGRTSMMKYSNEYGGCISADPCSMSNTCDADTEVCIRLLKGYTCQCLPDLHWDSKEKKCVPLYEKLTPRIETVETQPVPESTNVIDRFFAWLVRVKERVEKFNSWLDRLLNDSFVLKLIEDKPVVIEKKDLWLKI